MIVHVNRISRCTGHCFPVLPNTSIPRRSLCSNAHLNVGDLRVERRHQRNKAFDQRQSAIARRFSCLRRAHQIHRSTERKSALTTIAAKGTRVDMCACWRHLMMVQRCAHLRIIVGELRVEIRQQLTQHFTFSIVLARIILLPHRQGSTRPQHMPSGGLLRERIATFFPVAIPRTPRAEPGVESDNFFTQGVLFLFCLFSSLSCLFCGRSCLCRSKGES